MRIYLKNKIFISDIGLSLIGAFLLISCYNKSRISYSNTDTICYNPTPFNFNIDGFPGNYNIPSDNPMTLEGIELGRYLFYDGRLSGNINKRSLMSCATCHKQKYAFECGMENAKVINGHPHELSGKPTPNSMLPLINLVWNDNGYLWNGLISNKNKNLGSVKYNIPVDSQYNYKNIESLVWMSIVSEHEMNGNIEKTVNMIRTIELYPPMFKRAFGTDTVTMDRICKGIAQFVRSLVSNDSRFDKYQKGETYLTRSELLGKNLFFSEKADCFHCHGVVPLFTTNYFYNNAKDSVFNNFLDRFSITGYEYDKGAYRAPTLRNIEFTAPYMHDGRFKTIDEVLEFYNNGLIMTKYADPLMLKANQGGAHLNNYELNNLKAFLLTLSDSSFITDPKYSNPRPNDPFFIK
jgi:cytochrome c peroxidase